MTVVTEEQVKAYVEGPMKDSYDYRPRAGTVQTYPDPKVSGTFAVRFHDEEYDETVGLLFITSHYSGAEDDESNKVLEATLEEVEYETWPPQSGEPRFF